MQVEYKLTAAGALSLTIYNSHMRVRLCVEQIPSGFIDFLDCIYYDDSVSFRFGGCTLLYKTNPTYPNPYNFDITNTQQTFLNMRNDIEKLKQKYSTP
jgi:hypothetical protein